jgi:hypothetical protein
VQAEPVFQPVPGDLGLQCGEQRRIGAIAEGLRPPWAAGGFQAGHGADEMTMALPGIDRRQVQHRRIRARLGRGPGGQLGRAGQHQGAPRTARHHERFQILLALQHDGIRHQHGGARQAGMDLVQVAPLEVPDKEEAAFPEPGQPPGRLRQDAGGGFTVCQHRPWRQPPV